MYERSGSYFAGEDGGVRAGTIRPKKIFNGNHLRNLGIAHSKYWFSTRGKTVSSLVALSKPLIWVFPNVLDSRRNQPVGENKSVTKDKDQQR